MLDSRLIFAAAGQGQPGEVLIIRPDGSVGWGAPASIPVGDLCWTTLGVAPAGTVPANVKQKFLRGTYPQLDEAVLAAGNYLTDEAAWDAEASAQDGSCGRYCVTAEHIILPCYRHYLAAARPGVAGKEAGDWAGDAIRNITGRARGVGDSTAEGAFYNTEEYALTINTSGANFNYLGFDASRVVPTAEENRPKTSYALPCIKVADVAVNAAQVDMLALADQVAAINGSKADRTELAQIGVGQSWQDVTTERDAGVVYTNTTNKPILISISTIDDAGGASIIVDDVVVQTNNNELYISSALTAIVPSGSTYKLTRIKGTWTELR